MDIIKGAPAAIAVQFIVGNQPVAPDVGSLTYTLLDQAGTAMAGLVDVPISSTPTTYQTLVVLPQAAHDIATGRRFERRKLVINFEANGQPIQLTRSYRVVPDLPHTVTADQVRAFIGIEKHELPDDDIDVFSAFMAVEKAVTESVLSTALTSGTTNEIAANTMITMKAVLDVLPSAKQRMAQSEKNGVKEFSRVDLKELDKLGVEAERRYQAALDEVVVTTEVTVSLFLASTPTDVITGA